MMLYVLGNPLVAADSVPLILASRLTPAFPQLTVVEIDPTEDFIPEPDALILDTVLGVSQTTVFHSLDDFMPHQMVSPHDYDLGFHLRLLQKIGKLSAITIIGIPANMSIDSAEAEVVAEIKKLFPVNF
jgi:Ni,Fe-hydrogenase maturation factor